MKTLIQHKLSTPLYLYLASVVLYDFAPTAFQSAGWQLLNLALLESFLRGGHEKPPLFNRIVIYTLRTLWFAKVLLILKSAW